MRLPLQFYSPCDNSTLTHNPHEAERQALAALRAPSPNALRILHALLDGQIVEPKGAKRCGDCPCVTSPCGWRLAR